MHYPSNYGYMPQTLTDDGDPVDVLVITPVPLIPGVVVTCRPIGILKMEDEAGGDAKVLAVPIDKILPIYTHWQKPEDMNPLRLKTIQHFFEHYKDLEPGKWVKVLGWEGPDAAREEVAPAWPRGRQAPRSAALRRAAHERSLPRLAPSGALARSFVASARLQRAVACSTLRPLRGRTGPCLEISMRIVKALWPACGCVHAFAAQPPRCPSR